MKGSPLTWNTWLSISLRRTHEINSHSSDRPLKKYAPALMFLLLIKVTWTPKKHLFQYFKVLVTTMDLILYRRTIKEIVKTINTQAIPAPKIIVPLILSLVRGVIEKWKNLVKLSFLSIWLSCKTWYLTNIMYVTVWMFVTQSLQNGYEWYLEQR